MKYSAYAGSWTFRPEPKGVSRYLFDDETGKLELQETILEEIAAGAQYLDEEKGFFTSPMKAEERLTVQRPAECLPSG